jgi:hypothetical protein
VSGLDKRGVPAQIIRIEATVPGGIPLVASRGASPELGFRAGRSLRPIKSPRLRLRIGESINVAFRSAKVATFAERKATKSEVIVSLILTRVSGPGVTLRADAYHLAVTPAVAPW